MSTFREVSESEFYGAMNPLDVHPYPTGDYPYTMMWRLRDQQIVGQSIDYRPDGSGLLQTRYLLPVVKESLTGNQ